VWYAGSRTAREARVFYEVDINEETQILLEGQASGALVKGRGGPSFMPSEAFKNSIDIIKLVASTVAKEVSPAMVGTGCTYEIEFSVRTDGNGTVMLAQDPSLGQFKVKVSWMPFGGS
jgi:hypothetical protein